VGERGARTREAIVEEALKCFEAKGYHSTYVEDIAEAVGISRATLYQYFEGKSQLFVELVHAGGRDLLRVTRRLGALGPTAEGYDNLHWWLGEWAWVHDKYRSVYLQWAVIDSPGAPMRSLMTQFINSYTSVMSARISAATGDELGLDPDDLSVALLAILLRVNDYRQKGFTRGISEEELLAGLATFVQLTLFPGAPVSALVLDGKSPAPAPAPAPALAPANPDGASWQLWDVRTPAPAARPQPDPARFGTGSPRVLQTVQRLLDAGAKVFAAQGYHSSSVEDVRVEAGLGRGTFYKYFSDKADLLETMAEDCAVQLTALTGHLGAALVATDGEPLRAWLHEFLAFHRRYLSVLSAWTEQDPPEGTVFELGLVAAGELLATVGAALATIQHDYPFDTRVASIVFLAMLERVPGYALGTAYDISDERIVEVLATLFERGLLARGRPRSRRRPTRSR
jgi:AcrR family transcriptional regulator